ncbi:MAG: Fic family protein [Candidatus Shapirobacteria bacterium]
MYEPEFTITQEILSNIGRIEAAKEVIENAPLVPIYEARFVSDALNRTVHHSTHLEGNDLTLQEAKKIIEGENIVARTRDVQEVINYRNVLKHLDGLEKDLREGWQYDPDVLGKINEIVCDRLIDPGQLGVFRSVQAILKDDQSGEIVFRPPPAVEVPYLLEDFFAWLNSVEGKKIHPVLRAGIAHYYLVAVHPFVEGNGRSARTFATLVLFAENYDIKKFFSLEEYFDKDSAQYYQALFDVDTSHSDSDIGSRDLTPWLEYFTQAMAIELTRIKEKVKQLSLDVKIKRQIGHQVPLKERQMKIMEYLEANGSMTTAEARVAVPGYSDDSLVRDFNYLLNKGLLRKVGKTKSARYCLKKS